MNTNNYDVLIIGSGITGMTAAYYLHKAGKKVLVIDKQQRPGGVIHSANENGFTFEMGPNTGIISNMEVVRLFEELAPECELQVANELVKKRYILKDGKWEALPGSPGAAIKTPLFPGREKFRVLGEPFRSRGKNPHETLAQFVERRLGKSFLEYAIDPFILGVYAGDPSRLVPKYALPKLYNLEQQYGSLIGGTIRKKFADKTPKDQRPSKAVFTAAGGLTSIITALYNRIGAENFRLGFEVKTIQPGNDGYNIETKDAEGNTVTFHGKEVLSTAGAYALDKMLPFVESEERKKISNLHYTKVVEIAIGFNKWEGIPLDGFGGLIPHKEKRDLLGIMFMSSLIGGRAPEGGALLSVFMGGVRRQDIMEWSQEKINEAVARELKDLMQLKEFKPDLFKVIRHEYAIPQYEVSSGERFEAIEKTEKKYPGLHLGGNLRNGIGMADRILQGKELADKILKQ